MANNLTVLVHSHFGHSRQLISEKKPKNYKKPIVSRAKQQTLQNVQHLLDTEPDSSLKSWWGWKQFQKTKKANTGLLSRWPKSDSRWTISKRHLCLWLDEDNFTVTMKIFSWVSFLYVFRPFEQQSYKCFLLFYWLIDYFFSNFTFEFCWRVMPMKPSHPLKKINPEPFYLIFIKSSMNSTSPLQMSIWQWVVKKCPSALVTVSCSAHPITVELII